MVQFTLNGKDVSVDVPEDTPLLWVLRHMLRELAQHCGHVDIRREQVLATLDVS